MRRPPQILRNFLIFGAFYIYIFYIPMKLAFFISLASMFAAAAWAQPAQPAQPAPKAAAQTPQKNDDDLQGPFFMVDESPIQAIKILESLSGMTSLQTPDLPNVKINFQTSKKLTRKEAILSIKSLLSLNGMAVTPLNDKFFRVAPAKAVNTQAPTFITGRAADIPDNQYFYTKFYELKYLSTDAVQEALKAFITPNGIAGLVMFPRSNAFLLTDTLQNQKRVEMLIDKIDVPAPVNEEMGFFQLNHISAPDMKTRLKSISGELLKKYFDKTVIEADERTNQIIVVTQKGNLATIKNIIEKLDIDTEPMTSSKVFYIKHGEAKDVASVLNQIIKGQQAATKSAQAAKTAQTNRQNAANRAANYQNKNAKLPTNLQADQSGASLQFSEYVTVVHDERSNSIVAYGTSSDLKQIQNIIGQVDVVLSQVKIDVIITEVSLADKQVSGLSTFGLNYSKVASAGVVKGWSGSTKSWSMSDSDASPAFSLGMSEEGFQAVFNVAEQNNKVRILSAPSVTTTHNQRATINVSKRYPLLKGTTSYDGTSYPTTKSEIEWRDIGILLEVTPRIGDNGVVQMEVKQTVESVVDHVEIDKNTQPIIGKREAQTYVIAMTNEIIVLGGLQQSTSSDNSGKVWLLSDIPLLGNIFKPDKDSLDRTELVIFIRPTLVHSKALDEFLRKNELTDAESKEDVGRYFKTGMFHDPNNDPLRRGARKQSSFFKTLYPLEDDAQKNGVKQKTEADQAGAVGGETKPEEKQK